MNKNFKNLFNILSNRVTIYGSAILVKFLLIVGLIVTIAETRMWMHWTALVISAFVVLYIINGRDNPGYKIAWIIPILCFPIVGGIFYLLFGIKRIPRREKRRLSVIRSKLQDIIYIPTKAREKLKKENAAAYNQSKYINDYAGCQPYDQTQVRYFRIGEDMFKSLKEDLKRAEHYIFLEFFIVEEGKMWGEIFEILKEKVSQGVDVRLIWDDFGSIFLLPKDFAQKLRDAGIKCAVHYPLRPFIDLRLNNRDHRKIVVIDGFIGYSGGINIADEYINEKVRFGHWKDTAVRIEGEAVWSLNVMFMSMWEYITDDKFVYSRYKPSVYMKEEPDSDGIVQPYCDNPLDGESVGETVYLNLINKAEKYVYITTPYLIIDNEMVTAITAAAKSGVDVRIITPYIPDKWYVHTVSRSYYNILVEAGVKIYEYTPGFIHAKSFVVDDKYAVVGTINMDYRSLQLHYECAVWMYGCRCIENIKNDFVNTMRISSEVELEEIKKIKWWQKLGRALLRAFSPML